MTDEAPFPSLWRFFSPTFNLPASGNIGSFNYHPNTLWQGPTLNRGNPAMEQTIYQEIAGPGSQLGTLVDAVLKILVKLEENHPELSDLDEVKKLRAMGAGIEQVKRRVETRQIDEFAEQMENLARNEPARFESLMARCKPADAPD